MITSLCYCDSAGTGSERKRWCGYKLCGVIRDVRVVIHNPEDYIARSNLMWESTMAKTVLSNLGKRTGFECLGNF